MKLSHITFLGAGHLAFSLISGLLKSGYNPNDISACDRNPEKRQKLLDHGIETSENADAFIEKSDVVVFAVKAKDIQTLAKSLRKPIQDKKPLIVSVAAGIKVEQLERWLEGPLPIVRAMPNTPALLQVGATALYANSKVTEDDKDKAESLMRAVGATVWVPHEHNIDTVTALSGSGPAYFFLMMEALTEAAAKMGLAEETAKLLTMQTALGAARMALESDMALPALIKRVATPGGTTEKALTVLEEGHFSEVLEKALVAAKQRALEISVQFDKEEG